MAVRRRVHAGAMREEPHPPPLICHRKFHVAKVVAGSKLNMDTCVCVFISRHPHCQSHRDNIMHSKLQAQENCKNFVFPIATLLQMCTPKQHYEHQGLDE